jgi:AsmA family protein
VRYGLIGAALALVLVLTLTLLNGNTFKRPIERAASARFGRDVTIGGSLQVRIWSRAPRVTVADLTVGGPPWEPNRPLAKIERLQIELEPLSLLRGQLVLRHVELDHPEIYLHQEKSGRANWTFESKAPTKAPASRPTSLPAVKDLVVKSGKLVLIDELRRLKVKGTVEAGERASSNDPKPFRVEGEGTINEEPFRLDIGGGALRTLSPDQPYPFILAIRAGENQIWAEGKVLKPFDLAALELQVNASGRDLAELFYLTRITLPNSPPFKLRADIARNGLHVVVRQIAGSLGRSDISGTVDIDASTKRPFVKADLLSRHLLLKDFATITGSQAEVGPSLDAAQLGDSEQGSLTPGPAAANTVQLFPDAHLQAERLRAVDADVRFRATSVEAGTVPFTQVSLHAKLEDGALTVAPIRFDMAQGQLTGNVHIDARSSPPEVHAELRASAIQLSQFKGKGSAPPPVDGVLDARAVIDGRGDSMHNVMSNASGKITAIVPNGDIRAAFAELTGVDVAKGIGLLLSGSDDRSPIRCGVAQFDLRGGTAHVQDLVIDTQNVLITGNGQIALGPEKLDLDIQGQPKKLRLVRLRAPVEIRGELLRPSFRLETGHVLKQGAVAVALGTLLTPLAAMLAFVDPGLAKDQNCGQLLAQVQQRAPVTPSERRASAESAPSKE